MRIFFFFGSFFFLRALNIVPESRRTVSFCILCLYLEVEKLAIEKLAMEKENLGESRS